MGKRVVILGGGMAGLSTAWFLTQKPDWKQEIDSIHVYQSGWRLGGKCASGRGPMRRIEEHGIHLFGGGYYNALPMMRDVFRALAGSDAEGHAAFQAAFEPQRTSVRVRADGNKTVLRFPANGLRVDDAEIVALTGTLHGWLAAAVQGMRSYLVDDDDTLGGPQAALLLKPALYEPIWTALDMVKPAQPPAAAVAMVDALVAALRTGDITQAAILADGLQAAGASLWPGTTPDEALSDVAGRIDKVFGSNPQARGLSLVMLGWSLALDFMAAVVKAWLAVIGRSTTLATLDRKDHADCLRAHGARQATLQSDLVMAPIRILYQFANGDPKQPRMAGGCFLHWMLRSFAYVGVPFWFFARSTGETIIAPLYEALRQRGVQFHFFHRVEAIELAADAASIAAVRFRVQATTHGDVPYQPLDDGCWPDRPLVQQLTKGDEIAALPPDALESAWSTYRQDQTTTLALDAQADAVVLAIPPAALPAFAPQLLARHDAWRTMAATVASVETQSLQLWLDQDSNTLGVNIGAIQPIQPDDTGLGAGFVDGFHTFADFSPLIRHEAWPPHNRPHALWYFSDAVPTPPGSPDLTDPHYPMRRQAEAITQARVFTTGAFGLMLPGYPRPGDPPPSPGSPARFDPAHLVVPDPSRATTPAARVDQQYIRANFQPSDRYVQVMPDTLKDRLKAGQSLDVANLFVAGDWTFNGLNVGCVESTVMSGRIAAASLLDPGADATARIPGYIAA